MMRMLRVAPCGDRTARELAAGCDVPVGWGERASMSGEVALRVSRGTAGVNGTANAW